MKKILMGLFLFLPTLCLGGYYDLQHYKIVPDTTNVTNDIYFRGDFNLTDDTTTVNLQDCDFPLIMYATGTVKCNRIESQTIVYGSTETLFTNPVTFTSSVTVQNYSLFQSSVTISSNSVVRGNLNVDGDIENVSRLVYFDVLSSSQTTVSITTNPNKNYRLVTKVKNGAGASGVVYVKFNADDGSTYNFQRFHNYNGNNTLGEISNAQSDGIFLTYFGASDQNSIAIMDIFGRYSTNYKSAQSNSSYYSSSTGALVGIFMCGGSWSNVTDAITTIRLTGTANVMGIGTEIELWEIQ